MCHSAGWWWLSSKRVETSTCSGYKLIRISQNWKRNVQTLTKWPCNIKVKVKKSLYCTANQFFTKTCLWLCFVLMCEAHAKFYDGSRLIKLKTNWSFVLLDLGLKTVSRVFWWIYVYRVWIIEKVFRKWKFLFFALKKMKSSENFIDNLRFRRRIFGSATCVVSLYFL